MNKEIQLFPNKPKRFKTKDSIKLYRGLASMMKAQINTADALKYYAEGLPDKNMAGTLLKIHDDIHGGISVYDAFKRSKHFDDMTLGLIKAGMDSGELDSAFRDLATRAETAAFFSKKIRKIVVIPSIVFPVLIMAFIYCQISIVPQIRGMVGGGNYEPKGPVKFFFTLSDFTIQWYPLALTILISIVLAFIISKKLRDLVMNLAMSKWRVLRKLVQGLRQATFLGVIKLLHGNGINMAKAIKTAAASVKGTPFHDELLRAAEQYESSGVPLAIAFSKFTSVDDQIVHMLSIGEKSASMGDQLAMLTEMYEEECQESMENFSNLLSFFVMFGAVSMVALVFMSVFMPIFLAGPEMMNSAM